jgi:hypothetical protein
MILAANPILLRVSKSKLETIEKLDVKLNGFYNLKKELTNLELVGERTSLIIFINEII